jgi:tRNA pseudouridine synthase 10
LANVIPDRSIQKSKNHYNLCSYCCIRQGASVDKKISGITGNTHHKCFICIDLMMRLDSIFEEILANVDNGYEFDTFLIGATLPRKLYEKEDHIRAKFKIRGRESIKNQFTRELRTRFQRITKKKIDYLFPDILMNVTIGNDNQAITVEATTKPLILAGRYTKKSRGISQKQTKCEGCEGLGCALCDSSGLSGQRSVEDIIAKELMSITQGHKPKFSWLGSEDKESLVLGNGRPFFVQISNPKTRSIPKDLNFGSDGVSVNIMRILPHLPVSQIPFIAKTQIFVNCKLAIKNDSLINLGGLRGKFVEFKSKTKMIQKQIYSSEVQRINDKELILDIIADGGIRIKQFVGGQEYMRPNISEIVGSECECTGFDILDIQVQ